MSQLSRAILSGAGVEEVATLIKEGVAVNGVSNELESPLIVAIGLGKIDIVNLLIDSGAIVNSPNADGLTPLHVAAAVGEQHVAALLRAGALLEARDRVTGDTPLGIACTQGDFGSVKVLLDSGADPCIKNITGHGLASRVRQLIDHDHDRARVAAAQRVLPLITKAIEQKKCPE